MTQREHEQNQTHSVAEEPDHTRASDCTYLRKVRAMADGLPIYRLVYARRDNDATAAG